MKIGILTFHRADNYGAVLQCWALCSAIKSLGNNNIHVIDYLPSYFREEYSLFPKKYFLKGSIRNKLGIVKDFFLLGLIKYLRHRGFVNFIHRFNLTCQMNEKNVSFDGFDLVFVGSDQVWNRKLTNGEDAAFSGKIRNDKMILASYAASTECHSHIQCENDYYIRLLNNYDFVSAREKQLNDYFNTLQSGKSSWVLDPTLLIKKSQWKSIAKLPKENNYLLIYTVPQHPSVTALAKIIAKERNLKIIELVANVRKIYKKGCKQLVTPEEFLGYFYSASYVVTTSFHGTSFSLIMQKQFSTLMLGRAVDVRAKDLLSNIGLEDRLVDVNDIQCPNSEIDYIKVDYLLQKQINYSYNYIKAVITSSMNMYDKAI